MRRFVFALISFAFVACGGPTITCIDVKAAPTWTANAQPIYQAHCVKCHSPTPTVSREESGQVPADANYTSYSRAAKYASLAAERIVDRSLPMPPTHEFDALSSADVTTIQQWSACGTKE